MALVVASVSLAVAVAGLVAGPAAAAFSGERRWELITPPTRNEVTPTFVYGMTSTGDRVMYATKGSLPGAEAGSTQAPNLAERNADGWRSVPVDFPYSVPEGVFNLLIPVATADMSYWVWWSKISLLPGMPGAPNWGLYSSEIGGGPTLLARGLDLGFAGASADARTIAFDTSTALLPADVRTSGRQAYEHRPDGLRLVGVDSAGAALSPCGATVGADMEASEVDYQPNPISRDGRRIFVSSPDTTSCGVPKRVYLRENGVTTTEISASRCTRADCNAPKPVSFMGATPSGSIAYLATAQQLTDDDVDGGQDLYRYEVASGALTRVSVGPPGAVAGVVPTNVFTSDDGSRVYFVASGALAPGAGGSSSKIYVADDRGLRLVTPLATGDPWATTIPLAFSLGEGDRLQTTADGRWLLFASSRQLTADDLDATRDVYLYDAEQDELTRVSGVEGVGNGAFDADYTQGALSWPPPLPHYPRRSITDDGQRVFFTTAEALIAADANATPDVYEWAAGELRLVTSGAPGAGSVEYRTASPDGRSVFFVTDESLVAADDDLGDVDLYVAREGGGFPDPVRPAPAACSAGRCAEPPIERLGRPVPASVRFGLARKRVLRILSPSDRARRRMAVTGRLTLSVRTALPGHVSARALAALEGSRARVVAHARRNARHAGIVRLRLRLSGPARRRLDSEKALPLRIVVRHLRSGRQVVVRLNIEPPR